jgi:hypothetical protein
MDLLQGALTYNALQDVSCSTLGGHFAFNA